MPKNTAIVLIILGLTATLLFGINIGKNLSVSQGQPLQMASASPVPSRASYLLPSPTLFVTNPSPVALKLDGSVYTDGYCGFSVSFNGTVNEQKNGNYRSVVFSETD